MAKPCRQSLSEAMKPGVPFTPHLHGENGTHRLALEKPTGKKPKTTSIRSWRGLLAGGVGRWRGLESEQGQRISKTEREGGGDYEEKKEGARGERGDGREGGAGREQQKRQWVKE